MDNIYDLKSRRLVTAMERAEQEKLITEEINAIEDGALQERLEAFDAIRKLIAEGTLTGFIVVARSNKSVFLTEVAMPPSMPVEQIGSYIGALEAVKLEFTDMFQGMPQMLNDGTIVATSEVAELLE